MQSKDDTPSFSLNDFRLWLQKQDNLKEENKVSENVSDSVVFSRLGIKRLEDKITEHNETDMATVLAEDYKLHGGKIISKEKSLVMIEVKNGKFYLPKIYTKEK